MAKNWAPCMWVFVSALICTFVLSRASGFPSIEQEAFFPIGVWYSGGPYRAPTISRDPASERSRWLSDLQSIKALGFNLVKTWVDWASVEAVQGEYDFSGLQQLLDLANSTGLRVLIQIYADSAPDWVAMEFPDADFVTETGTHIHSQSAPGPCQDNTDPRAAVAAFYQQVAKVASQSPATFGYDVWSEPTLVNWVWFNDLPSAQFCYCNASVTRFQQWLASKYSSLDALNAAWYRTFTSWMQVEPPRFGTILTYTDYIDWMSFTSDKLAQDLLFYASNIKLIDPDHIVTSHSAAPSVIASPQGSYGTPDDWKMGKTRPTLDFYGSSIYPKHALAPVGGRKPADLAYMFDGAYSASGGNGWYVGELQGGQGVTGMQLNVPVTAADTEAWLWAAVAHGAKSICFFSYYAMNQGYEAGGYGLVGLDGIPTARAQSAGMQAAALTANAEIFQTARPLSASVAILFNPLIFVAGGNTVTVGQNPILSMQGIYEALWNKSIPVDFLHVDDAASGGLSQYQLLYVPFALALNSSVSMAIAAWVASGGKLVAEARIAWTNEVGYTAPQIPPPPLAQVFGVQELSIMPLAAFSSPPMILFPSECTISSLAGITFATTVFQETLFLLNSSASALATYADGTVAASLSMYGTGSAILVGSFFGIAAQSGASGAAAFIQNIATDWAAITPPASLLNCNTSGVEVRLLQASNVQIIVVVVNHFSESLAGCDIYIRKTLPQPNCIDLKTSIPVICTATADGVDIGLTVYGNATSIVILIDEAQ